MQADERQPAVRRRQTLDAAVSPRLLGLLNSASAAAKAGHQSHEASKPTMLVLFMRRIDHTAGVGERLRHPRGHVSSCP
jgi:hypothetical protein